MQANIIVISRMNIVNLIFNIVAEDVVTDPLVVVVVVFESSEYNLIRPQRIRAPAFLFKQGIKSIRKLIRSYPVVVLSE
jgi:hypothetical protein